MEENIVLLWLHANLAVMFMIVYFHCFASYVIIIAVFADIGWGLADGCEGVNERERSFSGEFHSEAVGSDHNHLL